jgi:hypothetical protein
MKTNTERLLETFGRHTRLFIPVIHHASVEASVRAVHVARDAGADGVCFINQGVSTRELIGLFPRYREAFPGFPMGLNILGDQSVAVGVADFHWTDHATPFLPAGADAGDAPWMPGVAFKTHGPMKPPQWREAVEHFQGLRADVAVTSGPGTGMAASREKVKTIRRYLEETRRDDRGDVVLGIASGVTPENAYTLQPLVDVWLVATGIEASFGVLDRERTERLSKIIHAGA